RGGFTMVSLGPSARSPTRSRVRARVRARASSRIRTSRSEDTRWVGGTSISADPPVRGEHAFMNIELITPARPRSRAGNRATATRWARFLRELGHRVRISVDYNGRDASLMIALHAWRSADSIRAFSERHPGRPLIVVLTG